MRHSRRTGWNGRAVGIDARRRGEVTGVGSFKFEDSSLKPGGVGGGIGIGIEPQPRTIPIPIATPTPRSGSTESRPAAH